MVYRAANLQRNGIAHGFFGRTGGVSSGIYASLNCGPGSGDAADNVAENRRRALQSLSRRGELLTLKQVHGASALTVATPWERKDAPEADGMVANQPGLALGILSADCAPVLLADADAGVIGAAHAGWKGALAGVLTATIAKMEALGAVRNRIAAAVGPCISQVHYEVGPELRAAFLAHSPRSGRFFSSGRADRFQFDLPGFVAGRLADEDLGSIECLSLCTCGREDEFFSFRRATHRGESDYGRQLSAIELCD
ncbi:MAG: peptidoglycan editing factor PgeF [Alphaproteobacteria bacterium]|nr:peptidoglycan editing factor PgeF [Alphaproteobacteria bacterium]